MSTTSTANGQEGGIGRFFLRAYEGQDKASQKQAQALLATNLVMAAVTLAASFIMENRQLGLMLLGLTAVSVGLAFLVRAGKAGFVAATTALMLSAAFALLPFLEDFTMGYELYLITALEGFVLMLTGIISRNKWQSRWVMAIALAALTADFFLRVDPVTKGVNLDDYLICVAVVGLSAAIASIIMRNNETMLAESMAEAAKDRERLARLSAALESSKGSISMGAAVAQSAERTRELIDELRSSSLAAQARVVELATGVKTITEAQSEIARSSGVVGENVADQTAIVTESSAAIEEMTASMGNISTVTASRRDSIRKLKGKTEAGAKEMAGAAQAVKEMESSSASILDVVAVIRGVASRTNLLAMNAAIEAAHAGESGKGFAVVADEIRKLSETTSQNVKLISTNIKGTIDSVRGVAETNDRAQEIFGQIDAEVDEVAAALEEVARGLGEVTAGTDEILKGTSESVAITSKVKGASTVVDERIRVAAEEIERLATVASDVEQRLASIVAGLDSILAEAGEVSKAGAANEAGLRELSAELAKIG